MVFAVTPLLWVGDRFPDVSGPKVMLNGDDDAPSLPSYAKILIEDGTTVVVPSLDMAWSVLRKLGLSDKDASDRISHAVNPVKDPPVPWKGEDSVN